MYSVFLNNESQGHSFHSFYEKFIEICNEHKAQGRALAFAFILYDFGDAHLNKVINDDEYWLSLNATSGKYLTVFSLHYKPKERYRRRSSSQSMEYLTGIRDFNNPSEGSNKLIEKFFGKGVNVSYPAVLFFQVENNEVLDYTLVELEKTHIEESFDELKNYISKAVDAVKNVTESNKGNNKEIFDLIKQAVKGERNRIVTKNVIQKATSIKDIATTILDWS